MVSKDELLGMLEKAINQEEHVIVGWGSAINQWIPKSDLTDEQKEKLKDLVYIPSSQSLKHKEIFNKWYKKISEGKQNEF